MKQTARLLDLDSFVSVFSQIVGKIVLFWVLFHLETFETWSIRARNLILDAWSSRYLIESITMRC